MQERPTVGTHLSDSDLVMDALWGSPDALTLIHDRYCDEIYDLCWSYLRDREAAADLAHQTWMAAADRLWQLHEPAEVRAWLYEVAHQVAATGGALSSDDAAGASDDADTATAPSPADEQVVGAADRPPHVVLRELLWHDATGLTARDRRTLALHLGDGVDDTELAREIGIRADRSEAVLTRLRDRIDRTLGALLVARLSSSECGDLHELVQEWDGVVSPVARMRITAHVDGCDQCNARREDVAPWSLLTAVPVVFAPEELRDVVRADLVEVATGQLAGLPDDDHGPDGVAAGDDEPGDADEPAAAASAGVGASLFGGTSRTVAALIVAAGITGTATLGFSDAAWVTAVRHEARAVRDLIAGVGSDSGSSMGGQQYAGPIAPSAPAPGGQVAGGPDGGTGGGGSGAGDVDGADPGDLDGDLDGEGPGGDDPAVGWTGPPPGDALTATGAPSGFAAGALDTVGRPLGAGSTGPGSAAPGAAPAAPGTGGVNVTAGGPAVPGTAGVNVTVGRPAAPGTAGVNVTAGRPAAPGTAGVNVTTGRPAAPGTAGVNVTTGRPATPGASPAATPSAAAPLATVTGQVPFVPNVLTPLQPLTTPTRRVVTAEPGGSADGPPASATSRAPGPLAAADVTVPQSGRTIVSLPAPSQSAGGDASRAATPQAHGNTAPTAGAPSAPAGASIGVALPAGTAARAAVEAPAGTTARAAVEAPAAPDTGRLVTPLIGAPLQVAQAPETAAEPAAEARAAIPFTAAAASPARPAAGPAAGRTTDNLSLGTRTPLDAPAADAPGAPDADPPRSNEAERGAPAGPDADRRGSDAADAGPPTPAADPPAADPEPRAAADRDVPDPAPRPADVPEAVTVPEPPAAADRPDEPGGTADRQRDEAAPDGAGEPDDRLAPSLRSARRSAIESAERRPTSDTGEDRGNGDGGRDAQPETDRDAQPATGGERDAQPGNDRDAQPEGDGGREAQPETDRDAQPATGGERDAQPEGDGGRDAQPDPAPDALPEGDGDREAQPDGDREQQRDADRDQRDGDRDGRRGDDEGSRDTQDGNVVLSFISQLMHSWRR